MKHSLISSMAFLAAFCLTQCCVAQQGEKPQNQFIGKWERVKKDDGLPRLEITSSGENSWFIQAWGDCEPDDCDWGKVPLHLLGSSVGARDFTYGFASWDQGFKDSHIVVHVDKGIFIAEVYSIFKDNSGRANYRSVSRLKKSKPSQQVE